jgi:Xaa-Pro aminopeptidase
MRHAPIPNSLFKANRDRLAKLLKPSSLALANANDVLPTNADGSLRLVPNSDLFYLTGVEQEESLVLLCPDAHDEKLREVLFLRESSPLLETWEGHKLTKDEARAVSGIQNVKWLGEFPRVFRMLMCEIEHVYLNTNEHKRAVVEVETRDARFIEQVKAQYPLHRYERLARLMHALRAVKSAEEIAVMQRACDITDSAFRRVAKFVKPGVTENEVEAEFAHEFIRNCAGFAYTPIIASGKSACVLHYIENSATCRDGELLLLDVAAAYANYNSDLTRTLPVNGKFTRRQRQVYDAVLRVMRQCIKNLRPGKLHKDWMKEGEQLIEQELLGLGLLKPRDLKKQDPDNPAFKQYYMHGLGHVLGLDVHDVGLMNTPLQAGWVFTVEPGIYIKEEGLAVRLENNVVVGEQENVDLMADIPVEADEIEALMRRKK